MHDFINHHNLDKSLPLPEGNLKIHLALSRILDVMVHSMGEEIRNAVLKELDEYKMSVPAAFRE